MTKGGRSRRRTVEEGREGAGSCKFLLFTPSDYRLQEGRGVKRMIRKWIRLSPFPLSHQPGKEIQRGNLKEEKEENKKQKQMEVSQNRHRQGEKNKQATCHQHGCRKS